MNQLGERTMSKDHKRLKIEKTTPGYWKVTLNNPPINLYDPEMFAELRVLMDRIEEDKDIKVVVFDSADPDYFISHYDIVRGEVVPDLPGAAPFSEWPAFVTRLAQSRVISIAKVRGRARGHGSELALACDMRFASREKAISRPSGDQAGSKPPDGLDVDATIRLVRGAGPGEGHEVSVRREAWRALDAGKRADLETGMAKLYASEICIKASLEAMRIHGGYGYSTEYDVERFYRDAPLMAIGEGTNDILRTVIARRLYRAHDEES